MEWIPLDITIPADREAVALALYRAGYTVRQRRRKNSLKSRAIAVFETRRYESAGI